MALFVIEFGELDGSKACMCGIGIEFGCGSEIGLGEGEVGDFEGKKAL